MLSKSVAGVLVNLSAQPLKACSVVKRAWQDESQCRRFRVSVMGKSFIANLFVPEPQVPFDTRRGCGSGRCGGKYARGSKLIAVCDLDRFLFGSCRKS